MTPERELAIYATGVVIAIVVACVAIVWLIAPAAAQAQSAEAQARAAINAKGYECPEVTVAQGVAMVSNGDALIGAACSNGERFVLQYNVDADQVTRVIKCWALAEHVPFCR